MGFPIDQEVPKRCHSKDFAFSLKNQEAEITYLIFYENFSKLCSTRLKIILEKLSSQLFVWVHPSCEQKFSILTG